MQQYIFWTAFTAACLAGLVAFFYVVIQPYQHEKRKRKAEMRRASPQEIDNLINAAFDHFEGTELQGYTDN